MMNFVVDKVNENKQKGPNANWMQENCSIS
jgi:hypothetical protein